MLNKSYKDRVRSCYTRLYNSNLVKGSSQEKDLEYFEKWLNISLPRNPSELEQMKLVKDLCQYSPNSNVILTEWKLNKAMSKTAIYILLTNNKLIHDHFGLRSNIRISWNKEYKKYFVRLMNEKQIDNNDYPELGTKYQYNLTSDDVPEIFKKKIFNDPDNNNVNILKEYEKNSDDLRNISWAD